MLSERDRPFPPRGLDVRASLVAFLDFLDTTAVNKVAGLTFEQSCANPLPASPSMSLLGLLKHLTAVHRQHIQIHIGGQDLPALWRSDDHDYEFRIAPGESIESVVAAYDAERQRSAETLRLLDLESPIVAYGEPNTAGRLLVDVVQECARHVGHMDILRELIDGSKGE